ncbi:MAG: SBBP repeat-containing protein [Acidobacteriota bacterium]|nr:SBBP repeat-containing protein [Acidobacteriota bacterium]
MRAFQFSLIALFFVGWLGAAALPISFEARDRTFFIARFGNGSAHIHPDRVVVGGVTLRFLHAARESRLEGVGPAAPSTYLDGRFRRSFEQFPQLAIRGLYPGVDAIFHGDGEHLEYDLQLAAGASPDRVRLSFEGARRLRLDQDGNLIVETASGVLGQLVPRVFQTRNGRPQEVPAQYVLLSQGQVGFRLGKHDSSAPLTIDPILVYVKYFGGTGSDSASQVATDAQGNVYVAGFSNSTDFPVTNGSAIKPTPPLIALSNGGQTVTPLPVASELSVTAIGGTPDGNILYAATTDGIFVSTNAGATWRQTAPLPFLGDNSFSALTVNDIAVDVFDPARASVATSRGLFAPWMRVKAGVRMTSGWRPAQAAWYSSNP